MSRRIAVGIGHSYSTFSGVRPYSSDLNSHGGSGIGRITFRLQCVRAVIAKSQSAGALCIVNLRLLAATKKI
jgi:hypothetical protein